MDIYFNIEGDVLCQILHELHYGDKIAFCLDLPPVSFMALITFHSALVCVLMLFVLIITALLI